jgi:hypothetical protein
MLLHTEALGVWNLSVFPGDSGQSHTMSEDVKCQGQMGVIILKFA